MALSVKYADENSPGVLADQIGWIDYGPGFSIVSGESVLIINDIPGGYTISFTLSLSQTGTPIIPITAVQPPTLPGQSAFGTTGYVGIDGQVALYMSQNADGDKVVMTFTLSNITVTNSAGAVINNYSIIAADAEVTNETEEWTVITNGSPWIKIETLPAVEEGSDVTYRITGDGSQRVSVVNNVTVEGSGDGNVPAAVFLTESPTLVQAIFSTEVGREGVAFGVLINEILQPIYNCLCIK